MRNRGIVESRGNVNDIYAAVRGNEHFLEGFIYGFVQSTTIEMKNIMELKTKSDIKLLLCLILNSTAAFTHEFGFAVDKQLTGALASTLALPFVVESKIDKRLETKIQQAVISEVYLRLTKMTETQEILNVVRVNDLYGYVKSFIDTAVQHHTIPTRVNPFLHSSIHSQEELRHGLIYTADMRTGKEMMNLSVVYHGERTLSDIESYAVSAVSGTTIDEITAETVRRWVGSDNTFGLPNGCNISVYEYFSAETETAVRLPNGLGLVLVKTYYVGDISANTIGEIEPMSVREISEREV